MNFSALLFLALLLLILGEGNCAENGCSDCELTDKVYACLDEYTFALCLNTTTIQTGTIETCPSGLYCNAASLAFCTPIESSSPTCESTTTSDPESSTESTASSTTDSSTDSSTPDSSTPDSSSTETSDSSSDSSTDSTTDSSTNSSASDSSSSETSDSTTDSSTSDSSTPDSSSTEASDSSTDSSTSDSSPASSFSTESSTDASTTDSSSTDSSTAGTTTPSPEDNPDYYCTNLKKTGYFKVESDTTCKDYIYCYLLSGQYLGWLYHCNTNEYFNTETSRCGTVQPAGCT